MIAVKPSIELSAVERSQFERKEMAKSLWREGRLGDAQVVLSVVLAERLSPWLAVEAWVTNATFRSDLKDFQGALNGLETAAKFLDSVSLYVQATFFSERARAYKGLGNIDAALTDYAGASAFFEELGHLEYFATTEKNEAGAYLTVGDFARAHEHIDKAIRVFTDLGSETLAQAYDTQANIYFAEGKLELAVTAIEKAFSMKIENPEWLQTFNETRERIEAKLFDLFLPQIKQVADLEKIKVEIVRRALIASSGSLTGAGDLVGLDHKGVDWIISRHPELEPLRVKRRVRRKPIMKN